NQGFPPSLVPDLFGLSTTKYSAKNSGPGKGNNYLHMMKLDNQYDMQYKKFLERIDILKCNLFGVSPMSVGLGDTTDATGAAAALREKYNLRTAVEPLAKHVETIYNFSLFNHPNGFNDKSLEYRIYTPLNVDKDSASSMKSLVDSAIITRNDALQMGLNLPPSDEPFMSQHLATTPKGLEHIATFDQTQGN
ncbi:hypothetical protein M0R04_15950, partial [Candidatus Dojkabacteria bacterium]|nr:hypothetical protein [Candidatus Dojkabacteria bacterium]